MFSFISLLLLLLLLMMMMMIMIMQGISEGIKGIVTQPVIGAQEDGLAGFVKGKSAACIFSS